MSAAKRRRRQAKLGYTHLARLGRPIYKRHALSNIQDAIARERRQAQKLAQIKRK